MQIAAKRDSVELLSLFNKYAMNPPTMTIKLLTLIIESDRPLDAFKKQLQSLPASEVDQIDTSGNVSSRGGYRMDGNLLHFAVVKNLKEHVRILLEHGCDPKAPMVAHGDKSPLDMAIINGQMDFWDIMREGTELTEEEKLLQLRRMILDGKMEEDNPCKEFKELLSSLPVEMVSTTCIDATRTDYRLNHNSLLQVAAAYNKTGAVRLLLEKGVDPKATVDNGKTAMEIATEHEAEEVISFLCGAIGEEVPDNVKLRQLAKALYKDDDAEKFKTILTSLSPELVSRTAVGRSGSVLQQAVYEGKTDCVRLLLEHGVDSTVGTDEKEETPFDIAWRILFYSTEDTERNYTEIAELLSEGSEELSDKMKLRRLLKAMYTDDKFEGMEEFSEILSSLSPELVSSIALNRSGSVLRNAVVDDKIDFIRLLLEKG